MPIQKPGTARKQESEERARRCRPGSGLEALTIATGMPTATEISTARVRISAVSGSAAAAIVGHGFSERKKERPKCTWAMSLYQARYAPRSGFAEAKLANEACDEFVGRLVKPAGPKIATKRVAPEDGMITRPSIAHADHGQRRRTPACGDVAYMTPQERSLLRRVFGGH